MGRAGYSLLFSQTVIAVLKQASASPDRPDTRTSVRALSLAGSSCSRRVLTDVIKNHTAQHQSAVGAMESHAWAITATTAATENPWGTGTVGYFDYEAKGAGVLLACQSPLAPGGSDKNVALTCHAHKPAGGGQHAACLAGPVAPTPQTPRHADPNYNELSQKLAGLRILGCAGGQGKSTPLKSVKTGRTSKTGFRSGGDGPKKQPTRGPKQGNAKRGSVKSAKDRAASRKSAVAGPSSLLKSTCLNLHGWGHDTHDIANTAKSAMLAKFLRKNKPGVMGCTETRFRDDFGPGSAFLRKVGYVWFGRNSDRVNSKGQGMGGVGLLVRANLAGCKAGSSYANVVQLPHPTGVGGHDGSIWITITLRSPDPDTPDHTLNVVCTYAETRESCRSGGINMDEMWAGLGATAAARTAEGPTLWMGDMNAHTADRMEGNPDVPAVPARDGCKLNSGAPRPMNIVGRRFLEELGKADLRIVHGRSRFGRSPVWQHTYSGNIRQAVPPKPEVTQAKGRRKSKCVLRSAYSPKTPSSTECVPTFTVIDYMCVNTNMLQHVRDVDVSNEGAELSDHRMLLATLKVKPYTLAVEQVAVAQPDVVRWNLRSLEDPTTKKQFRAAFAAQTVSSVGESEKDQAALVQTIGRALDSVVGTVVVKSPKLGSVSGKANGWMNSPGLKAKLRKKRSLLAKQRKAMESPRATEHSRRQARWRMPGHVPMFALR